MGKTYVIGDIHGCYQPFVALLAAINPDPERDTIILLGDYIDRGPDSARVVNSLLALQRRFRHFITLRGNHEQMLLDYLDGRDQGVFLYTGGAATLESYGLDSQAPGSGAPGNIPESHRRFFAELPLYWEDEAFIYVHAGLEPGVHLSQQSPEWLLWSRDEFIDTAYDFGKTVIFGHTPFARPRVEPNKIGIDTGAVYGGSLTCLILPDREFVSVPGRCK